MEIKPSSLKQDILKMGRVLDERLVRMQFHRGISVAQLVVVVVGGVVCAEILDATEMGWNYLPATCEGGVA